MQLVDLSLFSYEQQGDLTALKTLTRLESLQLALYERGDLTPLTTLVRLQTLDLRFYERGDLRPLSTLVRLRILHLDMYEEQVVGDSLSKLVELRTLHLGSRAGDLSFLTKLTQLQYLVLSRYAAGNLEPLASLAQHLTTLDLSSYGAGGDVSPLTNLVRLESLDMTRYRFVSADDRSAFLRSFAPGAEIRVS